MGILDAMSTIAIYLEDGLEARLRAAAVKANLPVSRLVASWVEQHTRDQWPPEVMALAGSMKDEEWTRPEYGPESPRVSW